MKTAELRAGARRVLLTTTCLALLSGAAVSAQEWKTHGKYRTIPMLPEYGLSGGVHSDGANNIAWAQDPAWREKWKLEFRRGADGKTLAYVDGKLLDTRIPKTGELERAMFVMDAEGSFYVLMEAWIPWEDPSSHPKFRHSTLPAGQNVAAAGMIEVVDGEIKYINNESGHYLPDNRNLVQAIKSLEEHGISKSDLDQKVDFRVEDNPGDAYLALDPRAAEKLKEGRISGRLVDAADAPSQGRPPPGDDPQDKPTTVDDAGLLKPDEPTPIPELDIARRAQHQTPSAAGPEAEKRVDPPDPSVVQRIRDRIEQTPAAGMDVGFMQEIYQLDPKAAKIVGQIMADPALAAKNEKMGDLRRAMDLQVWKAILARRGIRIEITNQGKHNGIRSDLDYTLYYIAEEAGVSIKDLIAEHARIWQSLHQLNPDQLEIKVMNGDEFYPDWRSEKLAEADHRVAVKGILGQLRADPEKYSVPGANRQQVHNRALRDGWTEVLQYDPAFDKPGVPIEKQIVREQGPTREIAVRYRGVHPQYNHMNVLGNLVQNKGEFLHHTGNGAQDAIRRAKYFNRVINEGLGGRFSANDYKQLFDSDLPNRDELKLKYLRIALDPRTDDDGKPILDDAQLKHFRDVIDVSMRIELDKTGNRADYTKQRADYFKSYRARAEATVAGRLGDQEVAPEERGKLILAEQERLFELDQKRVLAEAVLAGLRYSVARDLTPQGALRNRVRFDPASGKFVIDPEGARKVAFERAAEVALFYELVNSLDDSDPAAMFMKREMKKRALSTAPSIEVAEFYGALDEVGKAEIDRFVAGDPESRVARKMDDLLRNQQARTLELLIERKRQAVEWARARGIAVDPGAVPAGQVRAHIVGARLDALGPDRRSQFTAAFRELGTGLSGSVKQSFQQNASALMLGSSTVNLVRAYQLGGAEALRGAAFSEMINYMPGSVQTPLYLVDMVAKVNRGEYGAAAWQGTFWVAMYKWPELGNAMLAYNIATGVPDIIHTHFVTRIDVDLVEQALRSRPRDDSGGPLRDGVRARPNRSPDAKESVYHGSGPGFPLFYGRYKNEHARDPIVVDGEKYSDGTVPEDNLSDEQLARAAGTEFAPEIVRILTAENLAPGGTEWRKRVWDLKLKFGFDLPFYRRMAKVYHDKYKYVTFHENWPRGLNPEYLAECRLDVYDWYVRQPGGYQAELRGDAPTFFGDQSDKMQNMIAEECARIMTGMHKLDTDAEKIHRANLKAFDDAMSRTFEAERAVVAAERAVTRRIETGEREALGKVNREALALAEKHKTHFAMTYPFSYATEELRPVFEFDMRLLPAHVKQPVSVELDRVINGIKEGAPSGWKPGTGYEEKFKPDARGWVAYRPVTADFRFTAHLLDADKKEVAQATLDLPIVLYEPSFSGSITVTVDGGTATGDHTSYRGALVTVGSDTGTSGDMGVVRFRRLKAGTHAIKVEPREGDDRHGPGGGSATLTDPLASKGLKGASDTSITVVLPYIPKPVAAAAKDAKNAGEPEGGQGGDKVGDKGVEAGGGKVPTKGKAPRNDKAPEPDTTESGPSVVEEWVTVPDVTGIVDPAERVGTLNSAGLNAEHVAAGNAPSKERELMVAEQNPKAGTKAKRGDVVTISVYQQFVETLVEVPPLGGLDESAARAALEGAGLSAAFASAGDAPSRENEFRAGTQSEPAGKKVPSGTVVTVGMYQGYREPAVARVTVPELSGLDSASAQAALGAAQLAAAFVSPGGVERTPDAWLVVAAQSEPAGKEVPPGSTVTVELALVRQADVQATPDAAAPAPSDGQPASGAVVPNVVGLTLEEAVAQLAAVNLTVSGVVAGAPPPTVDQALRIYGQTPAAGTPLPPDMAVSLTQYGSGEEVAAAPPPGNAAPTPTPGSMAAPPAAGNAAGNGEYVGEFTGTMVRTEITWNGEPSDSPQVSDPLKVRVSQDQGTWQVAVEVTDRFVGVHGIGGPGGGCTMDGGMLRCEETKGAEHYLLTIRVSGNELDGEWIGENSGGRVVTRVRSVLKASRSN